MQCCEYRLTIERCAKQNKTKKEGKTSLQQSNSLFHSPFQDQNVKKTRSKKPINQNTTQQENTDNIKHHCKEL
jgi:hypothetical protein